MTNGYRLLGAALMTATLAVPIAVGAQEGPPVTPVGGAGAPVGGGRGPGQLSAFRAPSPIRAGEQISVLVFPFGYRAPDMPSADDTAKLAPEKLDLAATVTANVKAGFLATPAFTVATYGPQSSLILRARRDDILSAAQVQDVLSAETGAVDVAKARIIAHRLGIQTVLVGTIEDTFDAKKNSLEITLDTQLLNSTTGEVLRAAAVSGAAAGAEGVAMSALVDAAARDLAVKLFPAIGIQLVPQGAVPASRASKPTPKAAPKAAPKKDPKKTDRKAEREAEAAARVAREQAERDARAAERTARAADDAAKRTTEKRAAAASDSRTGGDKPTSRVGLATAEEAAAEMQGAAKPASSPRAVQGVSTAAGDPVPYGYAIQPGQSVLPKRDRSGLRVPAWLGVAAFLTGISFLL